MPSTRPSGYINFGKHTHKKVHFMIILWCIRDFSRSDLRNLFKDMQRILRLLKIMSKYFRTTFPLDLINHVERQRLCYKTAKKKAA